MRTDQENRDISSSRTESKKQKETLQNFEMSTLTTENIRLALSNGINPSQLLKLFETDKRLKEFFNAPSGVSEEITIGEHTLSVLTKLAQYSFLDGELSTRYNALSREMLALTVVFHDLDKVPLNEESPDMSKEAQHARALRVFSAYQHILPDEYCNPTLMKLLIKNEILGDFMKEVRLEGAIWNNKKEFATQAELVKDESMRSALYLKEYKEWEAGAKKDHIPDIDQLYRDTAAALKQEAEKVDLSTTELLYYQTAYYCCDCASYELMGYLFERKPDAKLLSDAIFSFDERLGRIHFSKNFEPHYLELVKECSLIDEK